MKQEVNPQDTSRAKAFELWIKSPVPMVTFTKTFDVTRLYKVCKRRGVKFNTLLCCSWAVQPQIDQSSICCPRMASCISTTAWPST